MHSTETKTKKAPARDTVKVSPEAHEWLKDAQEKERKATKKQPTLGRIVERLIAEKIAEGGPVSLPPPTTAATKHRKWHELLDAILDSGNDTAIRIVQGALENAIGHTARRAGGKS